jgi:hypothetical protein
MQRLEVDARAEHPPAAIAGMAHLPAAQQADAHGRVEQRQVHRGLHVVDLPVVLRVQAVVTAHRQPRDRAGALEPYRPQVGHAGPGELRHQPERPVRGPAHGLEQVRARHRRGQHPAEKDPLVDLMALLAGLRQQALGRELAGGGHQPGKAVAAPSASSARRRQRVRPPVSSS